MSSNQAADQRRSEILSALSTIIDPDLGRNIVDLGFIKQLAIEGDEVAFAIELTTPACPVKDEMKRRGEEVVRALGWPKKVTVTMTAQVRAALDQTADLAIKNIIAVASGKGGVGKSTVSVNLAYSLAATGARVGLLDADIYGPSIPHMLGLEPTPPATREDAQGKLRIIPFERNGLKVMSMGFLVERDRAVIWRGPMIHGALRQFFFEVEWGELDYLVVDLPPGTGDAQLTMAQQVKTTGAVVVTTPQDVAMLDARKALAMFETTNVPVLGIVENMSGFACPHCGETSHIFGQDGGRRWAEEKGLRFLGHVPIDLSIREHGDDGTPAVLAADTPESVKTAFRSVAEQTAAELAKRQMSGAGPKKLELST
ncbi:MAG: Mrp/NBP35 family ATP-binding protein [Planctomycetes bacterium]|nr:Mrp/NBP35 family ATP-binding protein [Planctomycetota bacterium]